MEKSPARLHNLDYLRGLSAFAIMVYHYTTWSYGEYDAGTTLGRIGIYGVAIFYVLSGLALYHVYHTNLQLTSFFWKRILRIFPLFWLATIATLIIHGITPEVTRFLLNIAGLFGFFKFNAYYAEGAWSIGNEFVFYVFFPGFIWLCAQSRWLMAAVTGSFTMIALYFSFHLIVPEQPLTEQWNTYINPINQLLLFCSGIMIGAFFKNILFSKGLSLLLIVAGMVLFVFYPVSGDQVMLVAGFTRFAFTILCICICTGFYKLRISLPQWIDGPMSTLGQSSYSVYLLHPIVWWLTYRSVHFAGKHMDINVNNTLILILAIPATLTTSFLVYEYFEKYFMKKGSQLTHNK